MASTASWTSSEVDGSVSTRKPRCGLKSWSVESPVRRIAESQAISPFAPSPHSRTPAGTVGVTLVVEPTGTMPESWTTVPER